MALILWLIIIAYAFVVFRILFAWNSIPSGGHLYGTYSPTLHVSVLIAARNEEENLPGLLNALAAQTYPKHLLEVLIIDDHSTDNTRSFAEEIALQLQGTTIQVVSLSGQGAGAGKKAALAEGIRQASGNYICTTDADCIPPPNWILQMAEAVETQNAVFVSGPVCYEPGESLLSKFQTVEFSGLIAIGGASISLHEPNMCNGANVMFSREAYYKVGGYNDNIQIASGDDEFLLHKISVAYPERYCFLKSREAIVLTTPKPTFAELMQQRIRWAGKWKHYQIKSPKVLAMLVGVVYSAMLAGLCFSLIGILSWQHFISVICFKFVVEAIFFNRVLRFFNLAKLLWVVTIFQFIHPPFVLAVAFATLGRKYRWKGRTIREQ